MTADPGSPSRPALGLAIAVHNRLALTQACLQSVFACWDTDPFDEIIVVDDRSTDATAAWLADRADRLRVLSNVERSGFGANMNRAAAAASSEFVVLLNNDTVVAPGWSRAMLREALADQAAVVVGNRQLYFDGASINHAGIVFDHLSRPHHLHIGEAPDFLPALASRTFQAVTGACWLVRRQTFLDLGGFDATFRNGYEDIDFCLRAGAAGWRVRYAGDSVIRHHVSASEGRHDHALINEARFLSRWRGKVKADLNAFRARDGLPPFRFRVDELEGSPGGIMRGLRRFRRLRVARGAVDALLRVPGAAAVADLVARRLHRVR